MDSSITKSLIRKTVLSYRKLLSESEYQKRNTALIVQMDELIRKEAIVSVHVFLAISANREPNMLPLLKRLWDSGITTVTSVTDFTRREMHHYHLNAHTKLRSNHLGIPEPQGAVRADLEKIDAVMVPLLLADKLGSRVGYGGGFYDKMLTETKSVKIGLSLSNPVDQITQTDNWDIPLDYLVTPYKIYNYG